MSETPAADVPRPDVNQKKWQRVYHAVLWMRGPVIVLAVLGVFRWLYLANTWPCPPESVSAYGNGCLATPPWWAIVGQVAWAGVRWGSGFFSCAMLCVCAWAGWLEIKRKAGVK